MRYRLAIGVSTTGRPRENLPITTLWWTTATYRLGSVSLSQSVESLPISALQHWLFCPRQCALIHVERIWVENSLTVEGRILHERTDDGGQENRGPLRILRSVEVSSKRLGIHGVADVVELRARPPSPFPIEYKRGRPKTHRADEVQLCAQALCLEEMLNQAVSEGAIFYGQNRRRKPVNFDPELRALTERVIAEARAAMTIGHVPPPVYDLRKCGSCSLQNLCRPQKMQTPPRIATWLSPGIASGDVPELNDRKAAQYTLHNFRRRIFA